MTEKLLDWLKKLVKSGFKVEITLKNNPDNQAFIRELKQKLKEII